MEDRKRIYIKDIRNDRDLLEILFNHNNKIQEEEWNCTWEDNMRFQEEECKEFNIQGVDIRDNYSSFYMRIYNYQKFIDNFNEFTGNEELQEVYKKAIVARDNYYNISAVDFEDDDKYYDEHDRLEEEFEKACDKVIEIVEDMLHEYEHIDNEEVLETFILNVQENMCYEDLYYYEDDNTYTLYEDISYTKSWK